MSLLDIAKNDKRLTNTGQDRTDSYSIHLRARIVLFGRRKRCQEADTK